MDRFLPVILLLMVQGTFVAKLNEALLCYYSFVLCIISDSTNTYLVERCDGTAVITGVAGEAAALTSLGVADATVGALSDVVVASGSGGGQSRGVELVDGGTGADVVVIIGCVSTTALGTV